jgi:hypothetical protein
MQRNLDRAISFKFSLLHWHC